jgi:membrane fusion protein (multidrug efflux system)
VKPGDKIVADGLNRVQDGAPVGGGGAGGGKGPGKGGKPGAGGADRKAG